MMSAVTVNEIEALNLLEHQDAEIQRADQENLQALAVGESFIDTDGDEWVRNA